MPDPASVPALVWMPSPGNLDRATQPRLVGREEALPLVNRFERFTFPLFGVEHFLLPPALLQHSSSTDSAHVASLSAANTVR